MFARASGGMYGAFGSFGTGRGIKRPRFDGNCADGVYGAQSAAWECAFDTYTDATLPQELMNHVVRHCDLKTLSALRCTNRGMNVLASAVDVRRNIEHWMRVLVGIRAFQREDFVNDEVHNHHLTMMVCDYDRYMLSDHKQRYYVVSTDGTKYTPDEQERICGHMTKADGIVPGPATRQVVNLNVFALPTRQVHHNTRHIPTTEFLVPRFMDVANDTTLHAYFYNKTMAKYNNFIYTRHNDELPVVWGVDEKMAVVNLTNPYHVDKPTGSIRAGAGVPGAANNDDDDDDGSIFARI
jgi:hypothetical protein